MAAFDLIEQQILGSQATAVTFSSIPATYAHLYLQITAEADYSDEPMYVQFNNDTNSNYTWFRYYSYGGTSSAGIQYEDSESYISMGDAISQTVVGEIELWIPNYADTSKWKNTVSKIWNYKWWSQGGGAWKNTAAISTLKVYQPKSNNLDSGGQYNLWGLKDSN